MTTVKALAAREAKGHLTPFEFQLDSIGHDDVDIEVTHCGICHSDLSMLNNEWGMSAYPFVPGHEAVGRIVATGAGVTHLSKGQYVGVGWYAGSCGHCGQCASGNQNLCPTGQGTIVGRHGGFASHLRVQSRWALPLPAGVDPAKVGPLMCGGITVFGRLLQFGVKPTDRVGVIGIGGLGHMAIGFAAKWGCEVFAFSSNASKKAEILAMGAHQVVDSRDSAQLAAIAGKLDFIISTVNVPLDWNAYLGVLSPKGRLHVVGAVLEPLAVPAFSLIMGQKSVSGSPTGNPTDMATMLDFAARHKIAPTTEVFPMTKANEALAHLEAGKARYRIVLENDLR